VLGALLGCTRPDRLPASLLLRLKSDCPCCSLYRALAIGMVLGAAIAAACFAFVK